MSPAGRWAALSATLTMVGAGLLVAGLSRPGPPQPPPHQVEHQVEHQLEHQLQQDHPAHLVGAWLAPPPDPPRPEGTAAPTGLPASTPSSLRIPAIDVDTPLATFGLTRQGTIDVPPPTKNSPAGWYRYSRTPGETGAAVIVGHVDSAHDGPAVFYRLGELRPGDRIQVRRADGRSADFVVDRVAAFAKSRFPTASVYGPVGRPALRLVTCGGSFDHLRGHYRGNIVVFATMLPPGSPRGTRSGARPAAVAG
jgi:hypothetical protein